MFNTNGVSEVESAEVNSGSSVPIPESPTKLDSIFVNWYEDAGLSDVYNFTTPVRSDMTLYARWRVQTYEVVFNTNGGSEVLSQEIDFRASVERPDAPEKPDSIFLNWYRDEGLSAIYDFSTSVVSDLTLYAKWVSSDTKTYGVVFNTNGGGSISEQSIVEGGTVIKPVAPEKPDSMFGNWFSDVGLTHIYSFSTPVTSSLTLYAKWLSSDANTYDVIFNTNGGSSIDFQPIVEGETATMPATPTRGGYSFVGWYEDEQFNTEYSFNTPVIADIVLYANWLRTFTVSFNRNTGTLAPRAGANTNASDEITLEVVDSNAKVSAPIEPPTQVGYRFVNWYRDADLTDVYDFSDPVVGNLILYASWLAEETEVETETYEVTFNTNGGSEVLSRDVNSGDTVVRPENPTKPDSIFGNWYEDAGLTDVYDFSTPVVGDLTLYAKWLAEESETESGDETYEVTFNTNGGGAIAPENIATGGMVGRPENPDPPSAGLFLRGWFTDDDFDDEDAYDFGTLVRANITLYAKWEYMVTYDLDTRAITGLNPNLPPGDVHLVIPASINGTRFTIIRAGAFENNTRIVSLRIAEGITRIGDEAFRFTYNLNRRTSNSNIRGDLVIPNSVVTIGHEAFANRSGFRGSLIIGESVETIGEEAFSGCFGFRGITIGESVETIGEEAFANCRGFIGNLTIPNSVETIGQRAFASCSGFTGNLTIGNSVKTIGRSAFSGCFGFRGSLTIGESVVTIGHEAFGLRSRFTSSLTIPNSVKTIGNSAFSGMTRIDTFIFESNTPPNSIGRGIFSGITLSRLDIRVPDVQAVRDYRANVALRAYRARIFAPQTFKIISFNTGENNANMLPPERIVTGNRLARPGNPDPPPGATSFVGWFTDYETFNNAYNFNAPVREDRTLYAKWEYMVTYDLDTRAITGLNPNLPPGDVHLVIPASINGTRFTIIRAGAFENNTRIVSLRIAEGITRIGDEAFRFTYNLSTQTFNSNIRGDLVIPNSVVTIGHEAFANRSGFRGSLTIGNSVETIGDRAFFGCSGFTGDLTIPNSVVTIGAEAFKDCSGFTGNLSIGNSVKTIGRSAFSGCFGFRGSLTIGNSVETIGDRAFFGCSGFTGDLTIGNSVETIGDRAFFGCSGFTGDLTIGNSVVTIGEEAFANCSGFIGNLTLGSSVETIGSSAFSSCNFTGNLTLGSSVVTIGDRAFWVCRGFTGSLTIPNSVETIGDEAFYGMKNIDTFVFLRPDASVVSFQVKVFDSIGRGIFDGIDIDKLVISFPSPNAIIYVFQAGSPHSSGNAELFFYYRTLRKYHFRVPAAPLNTTKSRVVFRSRN